MILFCLFRRHLTREIIWHESIFHKTLKEGILFIYFWERASAIKQGKYWYHLYNVFGITRSLTRDWTHTRSHHYTTWLSRSRFHEYSVTAYQQLYLLINSLVNFTDELTQMWGIPHALDRGPTLIISIHRGKNRTCVIKIVTCDTYRAHLGRIEDKSNLDTVK